MSHDEVLQNVEKIVEEKGLLLVDLSLFQAGRRKVLRILVDKPGRVTLDQCAEVSRAVGNAVETLELIDGSYTLEVSSPGIGRPLTTETDWIRCVGRKIEIETEEGSQTGILAGYSDGILTLEDGGTVDQSLILSAREAL